MQLFADRSLSELVSQHTHVSLTMLVHASGTASVSTDMHGCVCSSIVKSVI